MAWPSPQSSLCLWHSRAASFARLSLVDNCKEPEPELHSSVVRGDGTAELCAEASLQGIGEWRLRQIPGLNKHPFCSIASKPGCECLSEGLRTSLGSLDLWVVCRHSTGMPKESVDDVATDHGDKATGAISGNVHTGHCAWNMLVWFRVSHESHKAT